MSKAFDLVCHETLLSKLLSYGIRGNAHQWLYSYLHNRQQCVQINNISGNIKVSYESNYKINNYGVPQGSILGPLLFLLYANDLPDSVECKCVQFADDTTLIIQCKNRDTFEHDINVTLKNVIQWMSQNNLSINVSKTKYIQFQTYNSSPINTKVMFNKLPVEQVDQTVFLGFVMDKFLNWKLHVDSVCKKLDRFVYALYKLKSVTSKETALCAYHGYVSSLLRYGLILWGNSVDVLRVFRIQKKCIRAIYGAEPLQTCKPFFKRGNVLPLPCLYIFEISVFVHKHRNCFPRMADTISRSNRFENKLVVPRQRINLVKKNVYCMAIQIYNKLPESIKTLNTRLFKAKMFKLLLNKCYYSVNDFLQDNLNTIT